MNKLSQLVILILAVSFLGFFVIAQAGEDKNVSGFAWSETIGWISFNSTGDGSSISYGVNLDLDTGDLSGYAWSENIGWISFNRAVTGNPPAQPYKNGTGAIAKVDISTGEITGWFRVLAYDGGWDGWYRFCDEDINYCSGAGQIAKIDYISGDWHGWAWTDMVGGWLSFNSSDSGAGGSAYKVTMAGGLNRPPSATDLEVVKGNYCTIPAHYFSWTYSDSDGHNESQFQFQIDNNSDFSSPEVDRCGDGQTPVGGVCPAPGTLSNSSPTTNNQIVVVAVSPGSNQIGYNTSYYWQVRVWDSQGADSGWVEGSSFTTETHRYPSIDFNWSPTGPSQDEDVAFSDQSTVYGGSTKSAWAWTFVNGNPAISSQQNPTIQFTADGPKEVTLQVTDSDNFSCQIPKSVGVQAELPGWQEILPQ